MRLNLERLDASGLDLNLSPDAAHPRLIALRAARNLRGALDQQPNATRLSDLTAEELIVSLINLKFPSFSLSLPTEGILTALTGSYVHSSERTDLELTARTLHAPSIALFFPTFEVHGDLRATNVELALHGSEGRVRAESLEIIRPKFSGSASLASERWSAKMVDVSFGPAGYSVNVGELEVARTSAELVFPTTTADASAPEEGESADPRSLKDQSSIDWGALDGLSGALDVDLFVDMKVPVIGSRKATHRFRTQLSAGTTNYLELERDLSALENSLLDFAVRDQSLVLERGIPLLPTRGRGKPILIWPLSADDLALAREDRVRLAVLPHFRVAGADHSAPEPQTTTGTEGPSLALRELSFIEIQAMLRLESRHPPIRSLRTLSFEELLIQGTLHHRPAGDPRPGELTGSLRDLRCSIANLQLGTSQLSVQVLRLGQLSKLRAQFMGLRPARAAFEFADCTLTSVAVTNR